MPYAAHSTKSGTSLRLALAGALAALAGLSTCVLAADGARLPGFSEGAEVIRVDVSRPQIDTISGIVYSQVKGQRAVRQLRMTVMAPRTKEKKPAIIYFPGGGFTSADHEKFTEMRTALAEAGFVVAAAEYRTVPSVYPAPVVDAKSAVRYLRAHADEWGIDPARIGVLGDSAGGYVAQMLGTTNGEKALDQGDWKDVSSDVQAAVTIYGISDLRSIGEGFDAATQAVHDSPAVTEALLVHGAAFRDFPGASIHSDPEKARSASPLGHVDGNEPPFLILHGAQDKLVSPEQSRRLYEALKAQGTSARYVLVENAAHGDLPWFQSAVVKLVVDWFRETLKPTAVNAEQTLQTSTPGGNL